MTIENLRKEENIWTVIIYYIRAFGLLMLKNIIVSIKKNSHNIILIDQISGMGHILIEF